MKCQLCSKEGAYYRIKTNEWYCRFCGQVVKGKEPSKKAIQKAKDIVPERKE